MPHSFSKIWIHAVWATKERHPLIHSKNEIALYDYMRSQFVDFGCPVRIINGMPDHVHSLFLLNPKIALMDTLKQVKGSTSHWVNLQNFLTGKFAWQTGYAAYSVSESQIEKVFQYIKNQKQHHKKQSFTQEFEKLKKLHELDSEE